jgi:hypothetical protein
MNAALTTVKPMGAEPVVTTLFLKPSFGITVQSNTLCVSVSARPETAPRPRPPACG